jgi:hypothetical protein
MGTSAVLELPGVDTSAQLTSEVRGALVSICHFGLPVLTFERTDFVSRDYVVVSLLSLSLSGVLVARLCGVSEAHVSHVRARHAQGGLARIATRATGGAALSFTPAQLATLRRLRDGGRSGSEIARHLGRPVSTVNRVLASLGPTRTVGGTRPLPLEPHDEALPRVIGEVPTAASFPRDSRTEGAVQEPADAPTEGTDLAAAEPLRAGPEAYPTRYAGTALLLAAADRLGVHEALDAACARRPRTALYAARQVTCAVLAAWAAGYGSLEAMHERDAGDLGVVLGLQRSPSVRTLHRAVGDLVRTLDPTRWGAELLRAIARAHPERPHVFGVDGHFAPYKGPAPIDKGWDSKRRIATRGRQEARISDDAGVTWTAFDVGAGDALSGTLERAVQTLRAQLGDERPLVLAMDRGGFDFDVLDTLDRLGVFYVIYVPNSVSMPQLDARAAEKPGEGIEEVSWSHPRLLHRSRLVMQWDPPRGIPIATNLPTLLDAEAVVELLRSLRGWQENGIKAARAFAFIDALVDRGGASYAPDDRLVENPAHRAQKARTEKAQAAYDAACAVRPVRGERTLAEVHGTEFLRGLQAAVEEKKLSQLPARVERRALDPDAQRATLKSTGRALLAPLKNTSDNARRWLLAALGTSLGPSDQEHDGHAWPRTLLALLRAPGTVRLEANAVEVTLTLPLPPQPHRRIAEALVALDPLGLRYADGTRSVRFRLAPRPTREAVEARNASADDRTDSRSRAMPVRT